MSSGNNENDPMQERREAITVWEQGLRPKPERHWALWLALAALTVFLFYLAAEWLLTQGTARRPDRPMGTPSPTAPPMARPAPSVPSPSRDAATSGTFEVTKCLTPSGKAAYSDGPCPEGSRTTTVRLRRDVNIADGMSLEEREASIRNNTVIAAQQHQYEREVAQNVDRAMGECSGLAEHIKWLDALGRQPQSTYSQDWQREERRRTRDRQFRLACPQQ